MFHNQDHTLGNALRHCLMQRDGVTFCGYSVPHPLESKMNMRVQTQPDTTAHAELAAGMEDLAKLCEGLQQEFGSAVDDFRTKSM